MDAEGEDARVSSKPNAPVLFFPYLPFANEQSKWKIVPTLHLAKDTPPTLLFYGTKDGLLKRGEEFMAKSKEVGHQADIFLAEGVGHGFFNAPVWRDEPCIEWTSSWRHLAISKANRPSRSGSLRRVRYRADDASTFNSSTTRWTPMVSSSKLGGLCLGLLARHGATKGSAAILGDIDRDRGVLHAFVPMEPDIHPSRHPHASTIARASTNPSRI